MRISLELRIKWMIGILGVTVITIKMRIKKMGEKKALKTFIQLSRN
jgi:hypothetical protein